ncbi:hypothetical protein M569_15280, partial [Genlisea aurea]
GISGENVSVQRRNLPQPVVLLLRRQQERAAGSASHCCRSRGKVQTLYLPRPPIVPLLL